MKRALVSWSGGKDAAWALVRAGSVYDVRGLLTTVAEDDVVPVHEVSRAAIAAQAEALGLPLLTITLPRPCPNSIYIERVRKALAEQARAGVEVVLFGDLFLEDIRRWRQALLLGTGMEAVFPLWGEPTGQLAREMIAGGLQARVCAAAESRFRGMAFDEAFLGGLAPGIDPCGENGEFHTYVHGLPGFSRAVAEWRELSH